MNNLISLLLTCECLLRGVEEIFWADKILKIIKKSHENFNSYILDEIISWYGGMGSFNDLLISRYNSHRVAAEDEDKINQELDRVRSEIYMVAMELQKSTSVEREADHISK